MKIIDVIQGSEEWLEYRKGKISGTMLSDLYSKRGTRKIGFYQLIAERLATEPDGENPMERGLRLEEEAAQTFVEMTGKHVEIAGVCVHDGYPEIINSPDRLIRTGDVFGEALEIKCLSSARHLEAVITNGIPDEFVPQSAQYFIVNPDLQRLYFMFYDPRVESVPAHIITIERASFTGPKGEDNLAMYLQFQLDQLKEINEIVERLAF
jgi:putative phage-type endonuclease